MRMMTHSSGTIIAAGFDMRTRKADPFIISCSDMDGVSWEPTVANKAETIKLPEPIDPEAMIELDDKVLLIQPRKIIILAPQDYGPWVWLVTIMRPDTPIGGGRDIRTNDTDIQDRPRAPIPSMSEMRQSVRDRLEATGFKDPDRYLEPEAPPPGRRSRPHEETEAAIVEEERDEPHNNGTGHGANYAKQVEGALRGFPRGR